MGSGSRVRPAASARPLLPPLSRSAVSVPARSRPPVPSHRLPSRAVSSQCCCRPRRQPQTQPASATGRPGPGTPSTPSPTVSRPRRRSARPLPVPPGTQQHTSACKTPGLVILSLSAGGTNHPARSGPEALGRRGRIALQGEAAAHQGKAEAILLSNSAFLRVHGHRTAGAAGGQN